MVCYLLLIEFRVDGEVRIPDNRPCRWAWGEMFLATAKTQQLDDGVEQTQRRACPEIWEHICSNKHDAYWCCTLFVRYSLCTQKAREQEQADCFTRDSRASAICMSAIAVLITLHAPRK